MGQDCGLFLLVVSLAYSSTFKMEEMCSSESSVCLKLHGVTIQETVARQPNEMSDIGQ
jgi:hypothetical protein